MSGENHFLLLSDNKSNQFLCSAEHVHPDVNEVPLSSRLFTGPRIIREFSQNLTYDNIHLSRPMFGADFKTFPRCDTWISHLQNWEMENLKMKMPPAHRPVTSRGKKSASQMIRPSLLPWLINNTTSVIRLIILIQHITATAERQVTC